MCKTLCQKSSFSTFAKGTAPYLFFDLHFYFSSHIYMILDPSIDWELKGKHRKGSTLLPQLSIDKELPGLQLSTEHIIEDGPYSPGSLCALPGSPGGKIPLYPHAVKKCAFPWPLLSQHSTLHCQLRCHICSKQYFFILFCPMTKNCRCFPTFNKNSWWMALKNSSN